MKKRLLLPLLFASLLSLKGFSQMTIGAATAPNAASVLDLSNANTLGLYPPQVSLTATNTAGPIASPPTSLLVYNKATAGSAPNNVTPGYYYNAGTLQHPIGYCFLLAITIQLTHGCQQAMPAQTPLQIL